VAAGYFRKAQDTKKNGEFEKKPTSALNGWRLEAESTVMSAWFNLRNRHHHRAILGATWKTDSIIKDTLKQTDEPSLFVQITRHSTLLCIARGLTPSALYPIYTSRANLLPTYITFTSQDKRVYCTQMTALSIDSASSTTSRMGKKHTLPGSHPTLQNIRTRSRDNAYFETNTSEQSLDLSLLSVVAFFASQLFHSTLVDVPSCKSAINCASISTIALCLHYHYFQRLSKFSDFLMSTATNQWDDGTPALNRGMKRAAV